MAATYTQTQLGIKTPTGGFQNLGWYEGRQYFNGTFSDPGVIHPLSPQQGSGQLVSQEVNAQSATQQGVTPQEFEAYLEAQRRKQIKSPALNLSGVSSQDLYGAGGSFGAGAGGAVGAGGGVLGGAGLTPSINLPNLYQNLYQSSGISDKETQLRTLEGQFLEAKGKISDNPFLSASMIDQRLKRLQDKFDQETTPLRNEIATKKADIETQLNLQTKQFDINSQQARDAISYFNTMLNAGALQNASGEDIAQFTYATGIPSSFIYSAIKAQQVKNRDLYVSTFTADSGVVTAVAIDKNTGQVVMQKSLGAIGNAQIGTGSVTQQKALEDEANRQNLITSIKNYNNLSTLVGTFSGVVPVEQIYQLYNTYSPFGPAGETIDQVKEGRFDVPAS